MTDSYDELIMEEELCPTCHGEGEITFNPSRMVPPDPQMEDWAWCPDCHGTGVMDEEDA